MEQKDSGKGEYVEDSHNTEFLWDGDIFNNNLNFWEREREERREKREEKKRKEEEELQKKLCNWHKQWQVKQEQRREHDW